MDRHLAWVDGRVVLIGNEGSWESLLKSGRYGKAMSHHVPKTTGTRLMSHPSSLGSRMRKDKDHLNVHVEASAILFPCKRLIVSKIQIKSRFYCPLTCRTRVPDHHSISNSS